MEIPMLQSILQSNQQSEILLRREDRLVSLYNP